MVMNNANNNAKIIKLNMKIMKKRIKFKCKLPKIFRI